MFLKQKLPIVLLCIVLLAVSACKQAKYVPEGKYLYKTKKNNLFRPANMSTIHFLVDRDSLPEAVASHSQIVIDDLYALIKPQPNRWFNLFVYNRVDTLKMQKQIQRKELKTIEKNNKRIARQNAINAKRNQKAKTKGETHYFEKNIKLKEAKKGWRFWVSDNIGEAPVLMDSAKVAKSAEQIHLYLKKRGFFENSVSDSIVYSKRKQKAYPLYTIKPGKPITIKSIKFDEDPAYTTLSTEYDKVVKNQGKLLFEGDLLDENKLDTERERYTKHLRDNGFFNFSKNYIYYEVDTTVGNYEANVAMRVIPKTEENDNGVLKTVPHVNFKVSDVTYFVHNRGAKSFKDFETYQKRLDSLGLSGAGGGYPLLDTLVYADTVYKKKYLLFGPVDMLVYRGTFIYNEKLPVSPFLLDRQNFLEMTDGGDNGWYKEYYVERSYSRMLGLDVFSSITPKVKLDPEIERRLQVEYDLTPSNKQLFSFEPNVTNSNGYLGTAASVNYTNKNLFGGAERLTISITGGAESQPAIFDRTIDGDEVRASQRRFNTIEFFPKISLEFPRLLPMSKNFQKTLGKRLYPVTVLDLSYNYQLRDDFTRNLTEFSYSWRFNEGKTKIHQIKWQSFNYVQMDKSDNFLALLAQLNDPFLINTYNDHFSNKFEYVFTYNNQRVQDEVGKKSYLFGTATTSTSGFIFDRIGVGENSLNSVDTLRQIFGVPFTQFVRMDFDIRYYMNLNKARPNKQMIAYRLLAGFGYAYGNSPSLPYEESFFAGGSNDIRAFNARTMAPGGTQAWRDPNATNTQVSDMRLELNVEYRFEVSDFIKSAVFIDAGNIWKLNDDPNSTTDDLSVFKFETAAEQTAIGAGLGLRLDFDFFIVRLDAAIPIRNPYMFENERWIWESRTQYAAELETLPADYTETLRRPFNPTLSFGIGYPF